MCNWCSKDTNSTPMVSGAIVPMICGVCGAKTYNWDYKRLRNLFNACNTILRMADRYNSTYSLVSNELLSEMNQILKCAP